MTPQLMVMSSVRETAAPEVAAVICGLQGRELPLRPRFLKTLTAELEISSDIVFPPQSDHFWVERGLRDR